MEESARSARMNEIKLHDFSSRVACDCEYKQAFPERVFSLAVAYGVCP